MSKKKERACCLTCRHADLYYFDDSDMEFYCNHQPPILIPRADGKGCAWSSQVVGHADGCGDWSPWSNGEGEKFWKKEIERIKKVRSKATSAAS